MLKDFWEDLQIKFEIMKEDIFINIPEGIFEVIVDAINYIHPEQKLLKSKHVGYGVRMFRWFYIEHTFFYDGGVPSELVDNIDFLMLSEQQFSDLIDTHFIKKLEDAKKSGATGFMYSKYLPEYIKEQL